MQRRVPAITPIMAAVVFVGHGTAVSEPKDPRGPGTRAMAKRLEQIARKATPDVFLWRNDKLVEYYRKEAKKAKDIQAALMVRMQLAFQLLWAGQSVDAITEFHQLLRFFDLPDTEVPDPVRKRIRDGLAIAYLRAGEQENCIARHNPESCLFPIQGAGVHTIQRGSRAAIEVLSETLDDNPLDLGLQWLLNVAYMTLGEYPDKVPAHWLISPKAFEAEYEMKRFHDVASQLGVDVVGLSGGSIMEDFDGDGYLDLMASSWGLTDQLRYFHNQGDGTFTERTEEAGLLGEVSGLNLFHGDYNNDGHPDVFVARGAWLLDQGLHPNSLLRNNGDGTFEDVTEEAGLLTFHPTHVGMWADYDNDGWLDLFVANETVPAMGDQTEPADPHPCQLFHNNADGTFTDVASEVGLAVLGYVKGIAWGDYDNDGRSDLYLSRFGQSNVLYHNDGPTDDGSWKFTDVSKRAGVTEPTFSFPTWFWDYDNDGWLDLFVAPFGGMMVGNYSLPQVVAEYLGLTPEGDFPHLYRNNRDGTFTDVTVAAKLRRVLVAMGANYGDIDNDGFLDCYFGTGEPNLATLIPNRMFRNAGGRFFQDVTTSGGFGHLQKGHGIAFGDIDNDGDQDIYCVMGGAFSGDVFQNVLFENPGNENHWITLKLEGVKTNRAAFGARIKITVVDEEGKDRDIHALVSTGGSFGSSSLQQEIGLGQARSIKSVSVTWPTTGQTQTFEKVKFDRFFKLREGDDRLVELNRQRIRLTGKRPDHRHDGEE